MLPTKQFLDPRIAAKFCHLGTFDQNGHQLFPYLCKGHAVNLFLSTNHIFGIFYPFNNWP